MKGSRSLLEGLSSTVSGARKRIEEELEPLHRTIHELQMQKSELSRLEFMLSRMKKACQDGADKCVWHFVRAIEFDGKTPKMIDAFFTRELLIDCDTPVIGPSPGSRPPVVTFGDPCVGSLREAYRTPCPVCKRRGYLVAHYDMERPGKSGWELTLYVLCVVCPALRQFSRHESCGEADDDHVLSSENA